MANFWNIFFSHLVTPLAQLTLLVLVILQPQEVELILRHQVATLHQEGLDTQVRFSESVKIQC